MILRAVAVGRDDDVVLDVAGGGGAVVVHDDGGGDDDDVVAAGGVTVDSENAAAEVNCNPFVNQSYASTFSLRFPSFLPNDHNAQLHSLYFFVDFWYEYWNELLQ